MKRLDDKRLAAAGSTTLEQAVSEETERTITEVLAAQLRELNLR